MSDHMPLPAGTVVVEAGAVVGAADVGVDAGEVVVAPPQAALDSATTPRRTAAALRFIAATSSGLSSRSPR